MATDKTDKTAKAATILMVKTFQGLGEVMNKVGISGFVVIAIITIIFTFSTADQKHAIVDTWVLFKNGNTSFYVIVGILLFLMLVQGRNRKKMLKMYEQRNKELEKQIGDLTRNKLR